jgi:leucyl-tRNA synthetase
VSQGATPALDRTALAGSHRDIRWQVHKTLAKVTVDIGRRRNFNTAIAAVMELMNTLARFDDRSPQGRAVMQEALEIVVLVLAPIVPHVCHRLWLELGRDGAVVDARWPAVDAEALVRATIELVVQVNGKLRGRISVPADADEAQVRAAALADPNVQKFVDGRPVRMFKYVTGRLANVVV